VADDEHRPLGTCQERPEAADVAERGVVEALAAGERLVAPVLALPAAVGVEGDAVEVADVDVVEQRLARSRDCASLERELRGLPGPAEPRVEAEIELEPRELEPCVRGAATAGSPFTRSSMFSVDWACRVSTKRRTAAEPTGGLLE
jgi:hypothetical protein